MSDENDGSGDGETFADYSAEPRVESYDKWTVRFDGTPLSAFDIQPSGRRLEITVSLESVTEPLSLATDRTDTVTTEREQFEGRLSEVQLEEGG